MSHFIRQVTAEKWLKLTQRKEDNTNSTSDDCQQLTTKLHVLDYSSSNIELTLP